MLERQFAFGFALLLFCQFSIAQYPSNPVKSTSTKERIAAVNARKELINNSAYRGIEAVNIGPTIMSGRVVDVAVNPNNTLHFFVAYATGGVWETVNNGQSFTPVFDDNGYTLHCGALAVDWKNTIIYVGTGEANSSRSSYAGFGIFKCQFGFNDFQKWQLWKNIGLKGTQHISRIITHPTDSKTLFVCAMGNLFSPSKERGVYKTIDGGDTWKQILYIDENTSAVDLEMNPENPNLLVAAMWQKSRRAWNFWESGTNSGIYTSMDGGDNWNESIAFPQNEFIGRIGLSISGNTIYALVDNQERYKKDSKPSEGLTKKAFQTMSMDSFKNLSDSSLNKFLKTNRFPKKYKAKDIQKMVKKGDLKPIDLFEYLHDENAMMFEDPVKGAELYRSNDFGKSWNKTHDRVLENICYSYGYYFGVVHSNPNNPEQVFIAGVPLLQSKDGGETFLFAGGDNVHVDHHYIWINPNNPEHLINGNDGGINISYDGGLNWTKCNSPAVGQFYTVSVDQEKNYNVYGGLQDNGVWKGPNNYKYSPLWQQEGKYPYQRIAGGDGMQIQIDNKDNNVYTGSQFGHYYRIDSEGKYHYFHPMHDLKSEKLRWNWQTPILLSSHNSDILYMGSNKLHRSMDNAKTFEELSGDLSNGDKSGDVSYGTISTISESSFKFGYIYIGTDDGNIHLTKDGGETWNKISNELPRDLWVKKVVASEHKKERVYAVLNGHTWDHFNAYLFISEDYGKTWKQIGRNLPDESLNTLQEDPTNENILYLGSDAGLYISLDMGITFQTLGDIPPVAIHALAIQQENRDLIVGTHGRSIYKVQLEPVYQSISYSDSGFVFLEMDVIKYNENWGNLQYRWKSSAPSKDIVFFLSERSSVEITVLDSTKQLLLSKKINGVKGYNKESLRLEFQEDVNNQLIKGTLGKYYPSKGRYTIELKSDSQTLRRTLIVQ
ncbi:MAG: glycosyl hydrolase [Bacteroidetes bacterium]|nr:MAG: glycosyl hydrolase [Bacteroidota bacterium]